MKESVTIDALDRRIVRCIQLAPRIPFAAIASVAGVSEQTVARRYRRLHRFGIVRVTAVVDPTAFGSTNWVVRIQCRPSGAMALARALAQRDDVSWVTLLAGGSEITCVLRARTDAARDDLLIERLPRTSPVLGMTSAMVLQRFVGGGAHESDDWSELADTLDGEQAAQVLEWREPGPRGDPDATVMTAADSALVDVLVRDGRTPFAALAAATGTSEARAARRLRALLAAGVVYLDVDVSTTAFGFRTPAYLWLRVTPAELDRAGRAMARQREVAFAGAVTGPHNLVATVVCRDTAALYRLVTDKIGAIDGVQAMEVSPVLRHVKQAGTLTEGDRLAT